MADLEITALSTCLRQIRSLEVASNAITHVGLESLSTALMMEEMIVCVIFAFSALRSFVPVADAFILMFQLQP